MSRYLGFDFGVLAAGVVFGVSVAVLLILAAAVIYAEGVESGARQQRCGVYICRQNDASCGGADECRGRP